MSVPSNYSDMHRRFLQILMNRKMLSHVEALKVFTRVFTTYNTSFSGNLTAIEYQKQMEKAIKLTNKVIKQFNLEIKSAEDETTCQPFYLLINTADNPITRKFNKYSTAELEFFKRVLFEIISSDDGRVSSTVCLNLTLNPSFRMTKSSMEDLIVQFCDDLWLIQKDGKISLSLLSILELDSVLQSSFEEYINKCNLCKRLVIQGFRCDNCTSLTHMHCLKRFARDQSVPACPQCGEDQPLITAALRNLQLNRNDADESDDEDENCSYGAYGPQRKKGRSS